MIHYQLEDFTTQITFVTQLGVDTCVDCNCNKDSPQLELLTCYKSRQIETNNNITNNNN